MHPGTPWLKCGESGCKSRNVTYHAICHGVRISKQDVKSFCEKYIRCSKHVKQNLDFSVMAKDLHSSSSSSDTDDVFEIKKKSRVKKLALNGKKKNATKVSTPGNYSLEAVGKKIRPVNDKNKSSQSIPGSCTNSKNSNILSSGISACYKLSGSGPTNSRFKPSFSGPKSMPTKENSHPTHALVNESDSFDSE